MRTGSTFVSALQTFRPLRTDRVPHRGRTAPCPRLHLLVVERLVPKDESSLTRTRRRENLAPHASHLASEELAEVVHGPVLAAGWDDLSRSVDGQRNHLLSDLSSLGPSPGRCYGRGEARGRRRIVPDASDVAALP